MASRGRNTHHDRSLYPPSCFAAIWPRGSRNSRGLLQSVTHTSTCSFSASHTPMFTKWEQLLLHKKGALAESPLGTWRLEGEQVLLQYKGMFGRGMWWSCARWFDLPLPNGSKDRWKYAFLRKNWGSCIATLNSQEKTPKSPFQTFSISNKVIGPKI